MARAAAQKSDRPTEYSDELAQTILDRMARGEMLDDILTDSDMPDRHIVDGWAIDPNLHEFHGRLVRAREALAYRLAEKALSVAQDPEKGNINERRLIADQLWKFAAVAAPMGFGKQGYRPSRGMMASGGARPIAAPESLPAQAESTSDCPDHLQTLIQRATDDSLPQRDKVNSKSSGPF